MSASFAYIESASALRQKKFHLYGKHPLLYGLRWVTSVHTQYTVRHKANTAHTQFLRASLWHTNRKHTHTHTQCGAQIVIACHERWFGGGDCYKILMEILWSLLPGIGGCLCSRVEGMFECPAAHWETKAKGLQSHTHTHTHSRTNMPRWLHARKDRQDKRLLFFNRFVPPFCSMSIYLSLAGHLKEL